MGISKVVYGGQTLLDLTGDTVAESNLLSGYKAHGANGELINGACTYDANTQDATAADSEILSGKTAYVRGTKISGKMKNNGAVSGKITTKAGKYTIPQGYHDGSGTVQIDAAEQAKITPANIREGVTILGVAGEMSSTEGERAQEKTVTPSLSADVTVVPDDGYTCLSSVTVKKVPYVESENAAGGKTVTIG
jgi:hypothetical protein